MMCIRPFLALNVDVMAHVNQSDYVQVRPQAMSFATLFSRAVAPMDCVLVAACVYKKHSMTTRGRSIKSSYVCEWVPQQPTKTKIHIPNDSLRPKMRHFNTVCVVRMCVNLFEFLVFLSLVNLLKANTLAGNNLVFAGCSA